MNEHIAKIFAAEPTKLVISKPDKAAEYRRIDIERKGEKYQLAMYTEKQVFHKNLLPAEAEAECVKLMSGFKQLNAFCANAEFCLMVSKKGKITMNTSRRNNEVKHVSEHDRRKNSILEEGTLIPPLVDMGVFTPEGKVKTQMYDKYRQINRFIEIIDDGIKGFKKDEINIIDFGCGKSYLTFVVYHYLTAIRGMKVNMVGLALKADVIEKCNVAAKKYGYDGLHFEVGDINGFREDFDPDMVITLHACDTATDFALYNAIKRGAGMIFSVPCCQHELNGQMHSENLDILTKYGIIKERFAALATDAIRANLLEYSGYRTQLLEFIDLEHTPKNILIRAVKANIPQKAREKALSEVERLTEEFSLSPTLKKLLNI